MADISPPVAVYGYPTQLTPQEVMGLDLAPMQKSIETTRAQQADVNSMLVSSALQRQLQERALQSKAQIQQMRDQMMYTRLQGMENAKIEAVRQAGMNKNITDALGMAQDMGVTPPARASGMDDQAYLDSINQSIGKARTSDIAASTGAVKNSLKKMDDLARQKSQLEASVIPDAQKIALGRIGNLQQWVQQQNDPDLLAQYNTAAKAGQPPPAPVVQAYQNFAQAVFEQTKYNLLAQSGKQKQYDAIQAQFQLQGQLIHNALNSADRFGRVAPKAYAGQIINDATTQFEAEQAKAAQDAAATAAQTGNPADVNKAQAAGADAQRASAMANSMRQHIANNPNAVGNRNAQPVTLENSGVLGVGLNKLTTAFGNSPFWEQFIHGSDPKAIQAWIAAHPNISPEDKAALLRNASQVAGAPAITPQMLMAPVQNIGTSAMLAKDALVGTSGAPLPMPTRPIVAARGPVVQTNMAPMVASAPSPVNVIQLPQVQQAFQSAAQAPVTAAPSPSSLGIGGLDNIDPASMLNAARYDQMMNTVQ